MEEKIDKLIETLDVRFKNIDLTFARMDERFDRIEWALVETRDDINRLDKKVDVTNVRIDKGFGKLDDFVLHLERHDNELVALDSAVGRLEG